MISRGQAAYLRRGIMRYARNHTQGLWVLGELIGRRASGWEDVTSKEWKRLKSGVNRAMSLSTAGEWGRQIHGLRLRHEKEVLGQMELDI